MTGTSFARWPTTSSRCATARPAPPRGRRGRPHPGDATAATAPATATSGASRAGPAGASSGSSTGGGSEAVSAPGRRENRAGVRRRQAEVHERYAVQTHEVRKRAQRLERQVAKAEARGRASGNRAGEPRHLRRPPAVRELADEHDAARERAVGPLMAEWRRGGRARVGPAGLTVGSVAGVGRGNPRRRTDTTATCIGCELGFWPLPGVGGSTGRAYGQDPPLGRGMK